MGGDNSNKCCLSNTMCNLKSSQKFGRSYDALTDQNTLYKFHSMSRFFSVMSLNISQKTSWISWFPTKSPDSHWRILFLIPLKQVSLVRVVIPRMSSFQQYLANPMRYLKILSASLSPRLANLECSGMVIKRHPFLACAPAII